MDARSCISQLAALILFASPAVVDAADKIRITNPDGVEITHYPKPASQLLRVSFASQEGLTEGEFDRAVRDSLVKIAEVAESHSSSIFAVTNMFCVRWLNRVGIFGGPAVARQSCAIEGAWLKPGEQIVTKAKDNHPVYFATTAALQKAIASEWVQSLDLGDGLTGKVNIVTASQPMTVLGAQ